MRRYSLLTLLLLALLPACKHEHADPTPGSKLMLQMSHTVDGTPLQYNTLTYQNEAGESYSVTKLFYYLSHIRFYHNQQLVFAADTVIYIDAKTTDQPLGIYNAMPFSYDSIACFVGVPAAKNIHGMLPPTYENIAMQWPTAMGGGYHFMMLEGHWQDTADVTPGFTVHLGTDPMLVAAGCAANGTVSAGQTLSITLQMEVNEWFKKPHIYSFQTDGSYTMNDATLMQKITENGRDVLRVKP